ncbi:hydrogenase-1 operon protein HyaF2 [Salmonella enterica subsp. enterica]|uniref:Hydrogenase-1 operon protein HyaF2 n=1 Tax=Salmonella enterica I TaxID=59201 RepID=A0A3S4KB61_SALET|nr:hydrogenase-1 operon protein HyaF2 [Salmonella enterica subsp. enterica]
MPYAGAKKYVGMVERIPQSQKMSQWCAWSAKYVGGFTTLRWAMMYGKFHPACPSASYLITGAVRVCETSKSGFMVIDEGNNSCKD